MKPKTQQVLGWSLVILFAVLVIVLLLDFQWSDWLSALVLLPAISILAGLILLPAIMILKRRLHDLSDVISGIISIVVFVCLLHWVKILEKLIEPTVTDKSWNPLVGLLLFFCALYFPVKLHKKLKPWLYYKLSSVENHSNSA